jgi:hypothetical protein
MELLGGANFDKVSFVGIFPSPNSNILLSDKSSTVNFIDQNVDQFTSSQSPLEQLENKLKDYEKLIDIKNPQQKEFLEKQKALLAKMRSNLEAGKATLPQMNEFIRKVGIIEDISEKIEEISENRSIWLALTGSEQPADFNDETNPNKIQVTQKIQVTRNRVIEDLKFASPEEIAEVQRNQNEAIKVLESFKDASPKEVKEEAISTAKKLEAGIQAIDQTNKSGKENLSKELSDLEKKLKNTNLTNEERQSTELRIEKIEKAIELLKKIENDPDFKDKIWSKLSKTQQESILEDIKDGELTEESKQAITRATDRADETQTMSNGLFSLSRQAMMNMTGFTHEAYYEENKYSMNLVNNDFIRENIESGVYYSSSYDSSTYYSNVPQNNENSDPSNSNTVQERQAAIDQGLIEPKSPTEKMLAEQYGLGGGHTLLISYLERGDIVKAYEYAHEKGMTYLKESLQETMNRIAFQEVAINRTDEFFNLSFS